MNPCRKAPLRKRLQDRPDGRNQNCDERNLQPLTGLRDEANRPNDGQTQAGDARPQRPEGMTAQLRLLASARKPKLKKNHPKKPPVANAAKAAVVHAVERKPVRPSAGLAKN